ncbi:MAG: DUF6688 family protein, partial [Bacteroidota bacterium]
SLLSLRHDCNLTPITNSSPVFFLLLFIIALIGIVFAPIRVLLYFTLGAEEARRNPSNAKSFFRWLSDISTVIVLPMLYFMFIDPIGDYGHFATPHLLLLVFLLLLCVVTYFSTVTHRNRVLPLKLEFFIGSSLVLGMMINLVMAIQYGEAFVLLGHGPVFLLFLLALAKRHHLLQRLLPEVQEKLRFADDRVLDRIQESEATQLDQLLRTREDNLAANLLVQPSWLKMTYFMAGALVIGLVSSLVWALIGQDSLALIKVFTEAPNGFFSEPIF